MKRLVRNVLTIGLIAGCLAGCREETGWFEMLSSADELPLPPEPMRHAGLYAMAKSKTDSSLIDRLTAFLQKHPQCLANIGQRVPFSEDGVVEKYTYMGLMGDDSGRLYVNYFGHYRHPRIFAGRRIQLVLDRKRELERVLVYDLPLE